MKKMSLISATAAMLILAGCTILKGDPHRPGYQSGRTTAFAYMVAHPVLTPEVKAAAQGGYAALKLSVTAEGMVLDIVVREKIEQTYPAAAPEFHDMVFNFYSMGKTRLLREVDIGTIDVPIPVILENFLAGVEAALEDYGYEKTDG